jgi:hypothetical protein
VLSKGLSPSDRFLVEGVQKVNDGDHVKTRFKGPREVLRSLGAGSQLMLHVCMRSDHCICKTTSRCSRNFIRRPVLAIVVSLVIIFIGLLSLFNLPVTQFSLYLAT